MRKNILDAYAEGFSTTTYATDDYTAIVVNGKEITSVGEGEIWKYEK